MTVVSTRGVPSVDSRLAHIPEVLEAMGFIIEQRVSGYKCSKLPNRMNWMQWNDGNKSIRIRFCNDQGQVKTWKLFARFGDGFPPNQIWEKPVEYAHDGTRRFMLGGSDVWGWSYEAIQEFLQSDTMQHLEDILTEDIQHSYQYSIREYGHG